MTRTTRPIAKLLLTAVITVPAPATLAASVTVNGKTFDLDQFTGAAVTYRDESGNGVGFDGKLWDNFVGVDLYTLGELAAGQYGSDPGDQVSLTSRPDTDWLVLTYGTPQVVTADSEFVVFEITSSTSGVDAEGLAWKIGFNGNAPVAVSAAQVFHFPSPGGSAEDTNMGVFNLVSDFGFTPGDPLTSVRIENIDTGSSSTSDPDFIFAGITASPIPSPTTFTFATAAMVGLVVRRRRDTDRPKG